MKTETLKLGIIKRIAELKGEIAVPRIGAVFKNIGLQAEIQSLESQLAEIDKSRQADDRRKTRRKYKTALAYNIERLRLECGWSYGDLEHWADIDKSRILDHVKGASPYPQNLKKYADAFSKKLSQKITVEDLQK